MDRRYWRYPDYWRWRWKHVGSGARAPLALLAALAFGALGYLIASNLSGEATAETSSLYETTVMRTQVSTRDGTTVMRVVPAVRTVRIASSETVLKTATQEVVRTVSTPGGTSVVTDSVTTRIPVVRRIVVTSAGGTRTRVETQSQTVTNERTNVVTRTSTVMRTDTVTRTQTVAGAPVTVTQTQTHTVTQPTATQIVTVTSPVAIVTVTVPVFP